MNNPADQVTCRVLTEDSDWDFLRPDWERLFHVTPDATPWQSWDLLSRWWRSQKGSRRLRIVAIARGDHIEMILPLQLSVLPPLSLRAIEPLGMPDDINRPRLSLGRPDAALFARGMQALWERRHEWDALRIDEKVSGDEELAWLEAFATTTNSSMQRLPFHPCPYLELNCSWDAYQKSRSPRLLKNLRAGRRCLDAKGNVTAQRFDAAPDVVRAFDTLVALHERSWKHEARVGLSQSESYRAFYREFVSAQAQRGHARVWVLSCDEQPLAATLAFHEGATYYSAQIAHDEAFSKCSPGTVLEAIELEDLFAEGRMRAYDFLGGALNNKLRWTSGTRTTMRVWLLRKSLRSALFEGYYFVVKPLIKRLRGRTKPASSGTVTGVSPG